MTSIASIASIVISRFKETCPSEKTGTILEREKFHKGAIKSNEAQTMDPNDKRRLNLRPPCKPGERPPGAGKPKGTKNSVRAQLRHLLKGVDKRGILEALDIAGTSIDKIHKVENAGSAASLVAGRLIGEAITGSPMVAVAAANAIAAQTEIPLGRTRADEIEGGVTIQIYIPDNGRQRQVAARIVKAVALPVIGRPLEIKAEPPED